ncbi:MAG: right-handed parallel beta-helix repeat-containing protein [Capsulimonadaceae bacterium]|nr:right-handed parallel beta-helix repeat-containing protein [Capsulimonadaceae bacterium]
MSNNDLPMLPSLTASAAQASTSVTPPAAKPPTRASSRGHGPRWMPSRRTALLRACRGYAARCLAALGLSLLTVTSSAATVLLRVGPSRAYHTIQSAVDAVPAILNEPYEIAIDPGTYREGVTVTGKRTTLVDNVTLKGDLDHPPVVDAGGLPFAVTLVQQNNVVIEGLSFTGAISWGDVFLDRSDNDAIRRCIVRDNAKYDGICLSSSKTNDIEHNIFCGNKRSGIYLVNSSEANTIRFNIFEANGSGVTMDLSYGPFAIAENWNCFCRNAGGASLGFAKGAADLESDPGFINEAGLRLSAASPVGTWGPSGAATDDHPAAAVSAVAYKQPDVQVHAFTQQAEPYSCDQPVRLAVDCTGPDSGRAIAELRVYREDGTLAVAAKPQAIEFRDGLSSKATLDWQPPRQQASEVYGVVGVVHVGNKSYSSVRIFLPVSGLARTASSRAGAPPPKDLLYGCEIQPLKLTQRGQTPARIDPVIFDQLKANGGTTAHLIFWWAYIEPAPYQYDFSSIDWALEQCKRVGLKASISVWMADNAVPAYVSGEEMLDQYGHPFMGGRGIDKWSDLMPSLWGPMTRTYYGKLIDTICRKYLDDPVVIAWAFMYQHNEVVLHDRCGDPPILYDYSAFSQAAYRDYLKTVCGWNLKQVNSRYGASYASWEDVTEPVPVSGLDASLRWSDFQDFRRYSVRQSFDFVFRTVRSVDPSGKKILWAFNPEGAENVFDKYNAIPDHTSSEAPRELDYFLASRLLRNRPIMAEPTTIPPGPYEIGAGYFDALAAPVQGYWWVGTVVGLFPETTPAAQSFRRDRAAWEELSHSVPPVANLAILRSDDTALAAGKVFFNYPRFWAETGYDHLVKRLLFGHYDYQPVYSAFFEMGGQRFPKQYKLIIDTNSIVMRDSLMTALILQVRNGATLVIQPSSGRICREDPENPSKSLLARIGWPLSRAAALAKWGVATRVQHLGKGRVVMLAGDEDWGDASAAAFLAALAGAAGIQPSVQTTSEFRARVMHKGMSEYVLLFNENASKFVQSTVRVSLPARQYALANVTDGESSLPMTNARAWAAGYPVTLAPFEFRVYRLTPAH